MLDVVGCVVGHVWWWTVWGGDSSGRGALSTRAMAPEWLRRWMGEHWPRVVGASRPMVEEFMSRLLGARLLHALLATNGEVGRA
jgi:hypothetical protein